MYFGKLANCREMRTELRRGKDRPAWVRRLAAWPGKMEL
jgi:hypothetical protein